MINNLNIVQCLICFRPVTPASQFNNVSHHVRNSPCIDISNRDYSSSASRSQRAKCSTNDSKQDDIIGKGASASDNSVEVQKSGRQHARRSLHYDNNENVIDDATTEYVFSRKRPKSPESASTEQPRKRCHTESEACVLESLEVEPLQTHGTESERRSARKLSAVIIDRKSGQWKVSTPTREQTLTPRKDGTTQFDTPSKSVTFHDSVVGGDGDDMNGVQTQSPKGTPMSGTPRSGTPRSGRRSPRISVTQKCESPVQASEAGGKVTPRVRRSVCLTPKSSQKRTPSKSADVVSSPVDVTPRRSSARVASTLSQVDSSPRRRNKATPRSEGKNQKDLPVRRLLSASLPGTGRVLRPRTPKSYKFTAADDDNDDLYHPDVESSDEEEFAVKETPTRKATKEVCNCLSATYMYSLYMLL